MSSAILDSLVSVAALATKQSKETRSSLITVANTIMMNVLFVQSATRDWLGQSSS